MAATSLPNVVMAKMTMKDARLEVVSGFLPDNVVSWELGSVSCFKPSSLCHKHVSL